jgi:hypothetical protein
LLSAEKPPHPDWLPIMSKQAILLPDLHDARTSHALPHGFHGARGFFTSLNQAADLLLEADPLTD